MIFETLEVGPLGVNCYVANSGAAWEFQGTGTGKPWDSRPLERARLEAGNHLLLGDRRWMTSLEERVNTPYDWLGILRLGFVAYADAGAIRRTDTGRWSRTYADVGGGFEDRRAPQVQDKRGYDGETDVKSDPGDQGGAELVFIAPDDGIRQQFQQIGDGEPFRSGHYGAAE